jgi:hypothetical protein
MGTRFDVTRRLGAGLITTGLLVALVVTSVALLPPSGAGAAGPTVTNCNDSGAGSLRQAVASAVSGDTVAFALSPSCATITLRSTIDIATNLTILGPGAGTLAVSGGGSVVFAVASEVTDASVSGITIEDGSTGIDNAGTVTVTGCTVRNNGGGIRNQGTLTVLDSTLSDNTVGGVNGSGGGGIENQGTATVNDSTLEDNRAAHGVDGGAIANYSGSLTITDSTLSANRTGKGFGGGIYTRGGTTAITDSTLSGNSSFDAGGGGIEDESGTVVISDSTLSDNSSLSRTGGGAIASDGAVDISDSTLWDNSAPRGDGGGVSNTGTLTISNSTLAGNGARRGGAIFTDASATVTASLLARSAGADCSGTITDGGDNLDDDGSCALDAATDLSDTPAGLDPAGLRANGGPTETIGLIPGSPALGAVADASLCATRDQRGEPRPAPCDIGAVELTVPARAITSSDSATATVGVPFSFMVTTSGSPVPSITKSGALPTGLRLVRNHDGTATISGKATTAGTTHFTVDATFGAGRTKSVVSQTFSLTVDTA